MTEASRLRPLERRDLGELVQLCREHAEFERAAGPINAQREALGALFLDSDRARCWVVECEGNRDGVLTGYATAGFELCTWQGGHYLHLDCLFLRAAYRGQGWGRRLVEAVAELAIETGAVDVQWQTPAWNAGAARFYKRLGAHAQEKLRFTLDREACVRLLAFSDSRATKPRALR